MVCYCYEKHMTVKPIITMNATVTAPPAKAHTLRAILLGALAEGKTIVDNPLLGDDQLHLIECLRTLGVSIERESGRLIIQGTGGTFRPIADTIDVGESGVAMNTLLSATCLVDRDITITGSNGLIARPVADLVAGLRQLGCEIEYVGAEGYPPVIAKSREIAGGVTRLSGKKTSQYFSSMALSAPLAKSDVTLVCVDDMSEKPYFDITAEMMEKFGVKIDNRGYREIRIHAGQSYRSANVRIEGDYSSASFFMLAAAVCKSRVRILGLNGSSRQGDIKFIDYMRAMGCAARWDGDDLIVEGGTPKPITVSMFDTPDLVPPLAIAAAFAEGTSEFTNVGHLRYKECNRLEAIRCELEKMGITARYDENLVIEGNPSAIRGAVIDCWNDHRIAMSFAIAGLALANQDITDPSCVAKSFPDFWERLEAFYRE